DCLGGFQDPRMRGFRTRVGVDDLLAFIDARFPALHPERVSLREAGGRVLAVAVDASINVPPFDRSAMDGYAVHGEETFGADPYNPSTFRVIGEARPGCAFAGAVAPGEAVRIMTGAPLPAGSDCVVKVESTQADQGEIRVFEPTTPGRHVGRCG